MESTTRNLTGGEVLVARFKKREYRAAVVKTEDGIRIGLPDGRLFTSVSAAGTAIMGHACNGHRFWKVADESEAAKKPATKPAKPKAKAKRSRAKAPAAQPKPEATVTVEMTPEQKREAREEEQAAQPTEEAVEA